MDKIHNKANKLFDDVRKKKNKVTKTVNKTSTGHIADLPYKCCIYCQKVFYNSKFVMKHLLRRHSDELLLVYKNFNDREINNSDLIAILSKEFLSLKEFVSAELAVDWKHEVKQDKTTEGEGDIHRSEINQNNSSDSLSNEIRDLKEKVLDVEKDIHNLNGKFTELDNVLKNEVSMKQDVNNKLALSEEKILQSQESHFIELRQILLNELKSLLHNQREKISSECKAQLLELRHEIKRLEIVFNAKQRLTCTDSLKEEIKKELMPHMIPHVHSRKCEKKKLNHSLSKCELSVSKSHLISPPRMSSPENFPCKESNSKYFRRHSENAFETDVGLTSLVAEKLSQFSIAPNISKISTSDFSNKKKLLVLEKERLSKKYDSFNNIYDKLNMVADQKAHGKLKSKKHHKIKFADPLISSRNMSNHSSFEDRMHESFLTLENKNKQFNSTKKLMHSDSRCVSQNEAHSTLDRTNFRLHDKGASGDSVLPFSNKQSISMKRTKLSSIKEYEATSSIEDVQNSKDLTDISPKDCITVSPEQSKHKKQSNIISPSSIQKGKLDPTINNHFVHIEDNVNFKSPNKSESCDSNKQIMPMKHIKVSSFKRFETSSPIKEIQNVKNFNTAKGSTTVTAEQFKHNRESDGVSPIEPRKLNSAVNGHGVQIKEVTKVSDKLNELKDSSKSDEDFDDVSSLETYKSSNDDDDSSNYS